MTSVCFDALPDHSRQCEYAFTRTARANNSRQCETALRDVRAAQQPAINQSIDQSTKAGTAPSRTTYERKHLTLKYNIYIYKSKDRGIK